jgi:hypothetical protein
MNPFSSQEKSVPFMVAVLKMQQEEDGSVGRRE